ncbi:LPS-assembly protein LptD [Maritalea porphyrae]|uniref:LPS-assembly protein LptD n=1 Tax=Maritalea porphyrae TaxID=880732 RepID=A0ABQ5USH6_9HYPH|nr:LPS assembly protein LptD [Maritalea porphyrae]GLQ18148.1 LPS-assembly protein LptD [Maritalea porphyrae]
MSVARNHAGWSSWRHLLLNTSAVLGFVVASTQIASADQLLPTNFFANQKLSTTSQMLVSANHLTVNNVTSLVIATGDVRLSADGYLVAAERAEYNQKTGKVLLIGAVAVRGPDGQQYIAERAELFGGFRQGFLKSLVFETGDGLRLTAADAEIRPGNTLLLDDASVTPCGNCVDSNGRQIGWRIRSATVVRDTEKKTIHFAQGSLEIAGIPIAYLPWLTIPDPSLTDIENLMRSRVSYSAEKGLAVVYPGFVFHSPELGVTLTPEIYTRQGVLGELNWNKQIGFGNYAVDAWGIYQLDPSAYAGKNGDTNFRGGVQGRADFSFNGGWTAGVQASTFSDRSFPVDYTKGRREGDYATQRIFATQLTDNAYLDARAEYYVGLGESGATIESQQGQVLPSIAGHHVTSAPNGFGEFLLDGQLIRITRDADTSSTVGGTEYVQGFAGEKTHAMVQAAWRDQWTMPGGVLISPYIGVRGDISQYDGASGHADAPAAAVTHSITPIAALDVSWPLMGKTQEATHFVTPRLQVVSRGGNATPGITNENAQSFVFDDTNLFSFNRFSGTDRQETGTRASFGVTYHADLADGRWFDLTIGQSVQIGGTNSATIANPTQTGIGSGVVDGLSHIVIGAKGAPLVGVELGGKILLDPSDATIERGMIAAKYSGEYFSGGIDYAYQSQDMAPGVTADRHEIGGNITVPIDDYWSVSGDARYDLITSQISNYGVSLGYDDNYTEGSVYYRSNGGGFEGDRIGIKLKLKMLADVGYDHNL